MTWRCLATSCVCPHLVLYPWAQHRPKILGNHLTPVSSAWAGPSTAKSGMTENPLLPQALNCIMEMVEKTRRSMAVLRRCQEADREELNYWKRRCSETAEPRKAGAELLSRQHSPASADSVGSGEEGSGCRGSTRQRGMVIYASCRISLVMRC